MAEDEGQVQVEMWRHKINVKEERKRKKKEKEKGKKPKVEEGLFTTSVGQVSLRKGGLKPSIRKWHVAVVQEVLPVERGSEIEGAAFCW